MRANKISVSGVSMVNSALTSGSVQWTALDIGDPARPPFISIDGGSIIEITRQLTLDASTTGSVNIGSAKFGAGLSDIVTSAVYVQNALNFSESGAMFTIADRLKQVAYSALTNPPRRLGAVPISSPSFVDPNSNVMPDFVGQNYIYTGVVPNTIWLAKSFVNNNWQQIA